MSREVDLDQPLSEEDRQYLQDRGKHADIRANDERFGGPVEEDEEALDNKIMDLEEQAAVLRARKAALVAAREQEEAGVTDRTVVNGEGGDEPDDDYDDPAWTKAKLQAEIEKRNEDRDDDGKMSSAGTKAQLVERLRADDEEYGEDEEDEEE